MQSKKYDALFTVALALVFAWALWQSIGWDFKAGLFPWLIAGVMLVLCLVQLGLTLRGQPGATGGVLATAEYDLPSAVVWRRTGNIAAWIVGFVVAIWLLGFPIAVPLLTLAYLRWGAGESWRLSVGLAVGTGLLFYVVFVQLLTIFFERGVLLRPLGL
jgi:hypothetical protein